MRLRRAPMLLAAIVVFALIAAACGGAATTTTTAGDTTTTAPGATTTTAAETTTTTAPPVEPVTLRILAHQNPPFTEFMEQFNDDFEAANPGVTVDMQVVAPEDIATLVQTRLTANDVDIIDWCPPGCSGFSNALQPYMSGATPPAWQTLIEAGLLLDITDEPFVQNYDPVALADASSFDGRVYAVTLGRVGYGGMFVNNDLLAEYSLDIPTTWSELVTACDTVTAGGDFCMTVGGADTWPIFVGAYGLLGALYPDQEALVEGLWTGSITWNDEQGLELFRRYQIYATDMLEPGVTGLGHNEATARYSAGDVAFMPTGQWQAGVLEEALAPLGDDAFDWTYVPFPGSDNADDNQYLFGKYDMSWAVAAESPNKDIALRWLTAFSEPANYEAFANAVGFVPTQPTATLQTKIGQAVAPYLANYRVGFEQYWVAPTGAGQWANGSQAASWFDPFNVWTDATELANQAQTDLQAGLDASQ